MIIFLFIGYAPKVVAPVTPVVSQGYAASAYGMWKKAKRMKKKLDFSFKTVFLFCYYLGVHAAAPAVYGHGLGKSPFFIWTFNKYKSFP